MMPWKDQLRLGLRALRWLFWPADRKTWASIASVILAVTMTLAIRYQLWMVLLGAFVLVVLVSLLGRKGDDPPSR